MKLWKMSTGEEIRSFGGHNMSVSTVLLLSPDNSKQICKFMRSEVRGSGGGGVSREEMQGWEGGV